MDDIFTAVPDRFNPYLKAGLLAFGHIILRPSRCLWALWLTRHQWHFEERPVHSRGDGYGFGWLVSSL